MEQSNLQTLHGEFAEAAKLVIGESLVFSLVYQESGGFRFFLCVDWNGQHPGEKSGIRTLFVALCEKYGVDTFPEGEPGEIVSLHILRWALRMLENWTPVAQINEYEAYKAILWIVVISEKKPVFFKMQSMAQQCENWVNDQKAYVQHVYLPGADTEHIPLFDLFDMAGIQFLQKVKPIYKEAW